MLVGSYAKITQNPEMKTHLLDTGEWLLTESSPGELVWGIGYK